MFGDDVDNGAAYYDTVGSLGDVSCLFGCRYAKADSDRGGGVLLDNGNYFREVCLNTTAHACDAHGRNEVDKAFRGFGDALGAAGGGRGDEGYTVDGVFAGN